MPVMVTHRKLPSYGPILTLFPMSVEEKSQVWGGLTFTIKIEKHSHMNYKHVLKAQCWGHTSHMVTHAKIIGKLIQSASSRLLWQMIGSNNKTRATKFQKYHLAHASCCNFLQARIFLGCKPLQHLEVFPMH